MTSVQDAVEAARRLRRHFDDLGMVAGLTEEILNLEQRRAALSRDTKILDVLKADAEGLLARTRKEAEDLLTEANSQREEILTIARSKAFSIQSEAERLLREANDRQAAAEAAVTVATSKLAALEASLAERTREAELVEARIAAAKAAQ